MSPMIVRVLPVPVAIATRISRRPRAIAHSRRFDCLIPAFSRFRDGRLARHAAFSALETTHFRSGWNFGDSIARNSPVDAIASSRPGGVARRVEPASVSGEADALG